MEKYLIDTNIIIDYLRKNKEAALFLETQKKPNISVITLAEIYKGIRNKKELNEVKELSSYFNIYPLSLKISELFIDLLEKYRLSHGLLILDALIASTAIENKLILITNNIKHFKMIKELKLQNKVLD